jgi:NIPSNAP protein
VRYQLRSYSVKAGELDDWLEEWREKVYPLRLQCGFCVVGAWVNRAQNRFVWVLGHEDFERADRDYYASPARAAMEPDPARHLEATENVLLEPVLDG